MKPVKLIVVGDPHIENKAESAKSRSVDTAERVGRLVQHINAHHADAVLCLFIGNLADEGHLAAYEHFKTLIAPLAVPRAFMIGNAEARKKPFQVFEPAPPLESSNGSLQQPSEARIITYEMHDRHAMAVPA